VSSAGNSHKNALKISVVVMASFGVIFWIFPQYLIQIFQADLRVVSIGTDLLLIAGFIQIFDALAMTASGSLNGIGDTTFTMYTTILGAWVILVPMAYLLGVVLNFGVQGVWFASLMEISVISIILHFRFASPKWENKKVVS